MYAHNIAKMSDEELFAETVDKVYIDEEETEILRLEWKSRGRINEYYRALVCGSKAIAYLDSCIT